MTTGDPHLQRAHVLIDQGRHDLAEDYLRQALTSAPDHAEAHALLALCLSNREQHREASEEAQQAIAGDPDDAFVHLVLGIVLDKRDDLKGAEQAVRRSLELDPVQAHAWAILGGILLQRSKNDEALDAVENGLALDPEHLACTNLRAMILTGMGKRDEAGRTIQGALGRDPDSAVSHANLGWTKLHEGKPKDAMRHFREALRLEPEMEWARAGIVEAMKAHIFIYRWMLAFFLWMGRLSSRTQWVLIIGGYVGYQIIGASARANPDLMLFVGPVMAAYVAFCLMTWVSSRLFNLVLMLHPFGRQALKPVERFDAIVLGIIIVGAVTTYVLTFRIGPWTALGSGLMVAILALPSQAVAFASTTAARSILFGWLVILASLALLIALEPVLRLSWIDSITLPYAIACLLTGLFGASVVNSWLAKRA